MGVSFSLLLYFGWSARVNATTGLDNLEKKFFKQQF